jgi:hypothetical protein
MESRMTKVYARGIVAFVSMLALSGAAAFANSAAQAPETRAVQRQQPPPASEAEPAPVVPLKVTVVVARYQGEKRTSNLPYTLWVNTGDRTTLRMNNQVPIPQTLVNQSDSAIPPVTSFSYTSVGTSIDCSATALPEGAFRLDLTVSDRQVTNDTDRTATQAPGRPSILAPSIQDFSSVNRVILRDGQTVQYTTAVDKTTGEVIKLEVTLNVMK